MRITVAASQQKKSKRSKSQESNEAGHARITEGTAIFSFRGKTSLQDAGVYFSVIGTYSPINSND